MSSVSSSSQTKSRKSAKSIVTIRTSVKSLSVTSETSLPGHLHNQKYIPYESSSVWFDDSPPNLWLDLSDKQMGIEAISSIFLDLAVDTFLTYFSCAGNITAQEAYSVAAMKELMTSIQRCLYKNRALRMLNLSNNFLFLCTPSPQNMHTTNYLVKLTDILSDSTVTKVDISRNASIGLTGMQHTGFAFLVKKFLARQGRGLICTHTGLHSQSFALVADCLGVFSSMTYLDLSDNFGGLGSFGEPTSNGMFVFCTHLRQTPNLKVLKLARNHLRDEDFSHLAWAITGMQRLQALDLSGNLCHSAGMDPLRAAIECLFPCMDKGDGLKELNLSDNPLGPLGASYVVSFIHKSETLLKLQLANVGMDASSLSALLAALRNNDALMHLEVTGNALTKSQEDTILAEISVNGLLETIRVNPCVVDASTLSPFIYTALAAKLRFLHGSVLSALLENESFNVPLSPMRQALHLLAPPSRKELINKVVANDPKLPSRLREVRELNRKIRASEVIFSRVMPWFRKVQQHKKIQEALRKAMQKQISDNYKIKDGFEYEVSR